MYELSADNFANLLMNLTPRTCYAGCERSSDCVGPSPPSASFPTHSLATLWEILTFRISHLNTKSQNGLRVRISLMEIHVADEYSAWQNPFLDSAFLRKMRI